jgi:hypothetical protein
VYDLLSKPGWGFKKRSKSAKHPQIAIMTGSFELQIKEAVFLRQPLS